MARGNGSYATGDDRHDTDDDDDDNASCPAHGPRSYRRRKIHYIAEQVAVPPTLSAGPLPNHVLQQRIRATWQDAEAANEAEANRLLGKPPPKR